MKNKILDKIYRLLKQEHIKKRVFLVISLCVFLFFLITGYDIYRYESSWIRLSENCRSEIAEFDGEISLYVKDLRTGKTIKVNADRKMPAASVIKIQIMAVCFFADYNDLIDLEDEIILQNDFKTGGSGILKKAAAGSKFTVRRLIELMISRSDNTACNILINMMGFDYYKVGFKNFKQKNTVLVRLMMDMKKRDAGIENYTSALDVGQLLEEMYLGKLINKKISRECIDILKMQIYDDRIPRYLPDNVEVAHKTGLERHVCHDAGIVFTNKGDHIIVVLVKHHDETAKNAKKIISELSLMVYNTLQGIKEEKNE